MERARLQLGWVLADVAKQLHQAAPEGYVELNRRAFALTEEGGAVVSASCSYNVRAEAFVKHLASAAHSAGAQVSLEALTGASPDHPHLVTLPETQYLKCAFLRVYPAV